MRYVLPALTAVLIALPLDGQSATDDTTDAPVDDVRTAIESAFNALDIETTATELMTVQGEVSGYGLAAGTTVIVSMTSLGKKGTQVVVATAEPEDRALERRVLREVLAFFEQEEEDN
ncbi:MAG: hypothetical protein AAGH76_17765 [Pseudomonadota bacterium]